MKPRWRKVIHDLWDNKVRTLLVVFSIAVGVFSIGVIAGAYQIITQDMSVSYSANKPANVELRMTDFNEETLKMIRNQPEVLGAEGRRVFNIRVRVPGTEKWTNLDMIAFDEFQKNTINLLNPVEGKQRPEKREVLLEKNVLQEIDTGVGQLLEFQLPDPQSIAGLEHGVPRRHLDAQPTLKGHDQNSRRETKICDGAARERRAVLDHQIDQHGRIQLGPVLRAQQVTFEEGLVDRLVA